MHFYLYSQFVRPLTIDLDKEKWPIKKKNLEPVQKLEKNKKQKEQQKREGSLLWEQPGKREKQKI